MVLTDVANLIFASVIEWQIWDKKRQNELFSHLMVKILNNCVCLRSFARMFSLFLPPFYAPAFAQLVHESNSIGLGISFAIVISLGLVSCFVKYRSQHEFFPQWCWFFSEKISSTVYDPSEPENSKKIWTISGRSPIHNDSWLKMSLWRKISTCVGNRKSKNLTIKMEVLPLTAPVAACRELNTIH